MSLFNRVFYGWYLFWISWFGNKTVGKIREGIGSILFLFYIY